MSGTAAPRPARQRAAAEPAAAGLVTQHVRHAYWKYPIIALVLAVALGLLGVFAGSPNSPRATIAATTRQDPGGAALAFTQELAGTSASAANQNEFGLGENLFGLLARGDWESQFVAMHSDDMLFVQPYFFSLFSPANFTADLAIHVAVIPVILFTLIMGHLTLVRLQGIARPL